MKRFLMGLVLLGAASAQAGGFLDHPGFYVGIITSTGKRYVSSDSSQAKESIRQYLLSLKSPKREKALAMLNTNFNAVQTEKVKSEIAKLNQFCGRDDTKVGVWLSFENLPSANDVAYDLIISTTSFGASQCPQSYDMVEEVTQGKYSWEIMMSADRYSDSNASDWFVNTIGVIMNQVRRNQTDAQNIDVILSGSH